MSFSWSTSSTSSFTGLKPTTTTNSFADALKRLAEHVEEKNKINASNNAISALVQSSTDFSNRIHPSYVNNSISPEQTLRLYTQYIQEAERREDMRRCYLRSYNGPDNSTIHLPTLNRRLDVIDPYRFVGPHLSSLLHPSTYFQPLSQQTRIPPPPPPPPSSSFVFPNMKTADIPSRIPTPESVHKKSEQSSKPKSKLFRPYDLDSPNSTSHQPSPTVIKKSTSSPTTFPSSSTSVFLDELPTTISSGKEKQLFNSLGLVQQLTDVLSDKSSFIETSPSTIISEDSTSIETITTQQDNNLDKSLSNRKMTSSPIKLKRKLNSSSSNRKQSKIETIQN